MNVTEYDTLVFDCDGVVLNSNKIKTEVFYNVALPYGKKAAESLVEYHVANGGISRYKKFEYFIRQVLKRPIEKPLFNELLNYFSEGVKEGLLTCEIASDLDALREKTKNTNWLIVSGGDQVELREVFSTRGIAKYFDGGIFGSPHDKSEILSREQLNSNISQRALFLGDSLYDYQAATTAGVEFVFLSDWTEFDGWEKWLKRKKIRTLGNIGELCDS